MPGQSNLTIQGSDALKSLRLDGFPLASSFKIDLYQREDGSGLALKFVDSGLGVSVEFPWWDQVDSDLRRWSLSDVPCGSIDDAYSDIDQGWHILIWQHHGHVYIAQGGDEEGEYSTWFAVPEPLYQSEWDRVILASSQQ